MTGTNLPTQTPQTHGVGICFSAYVTHNLNKYVRVHYAVSGTTQINVVGSVHRDRCVGGDSSRETPGPIPNPEAKPGYADGTALGRVWESR